MIKKFFNMFAKDKNENGEEVSTPETTEEQVAETTEEQKNEPAPFTAQNPFEELLLKVEAKEVPIQAFFENLFNSVVPALTTEDQINKEENQLVPNPKLFSIFGKDEEPYLALFSDKSRVDPVINRYNEYNIVIPIPVGDLLMNMNTECGIVLNPYWDKYFMWSKEQINDIKKHMTQIDGKYRFVDPESENVVELQNEKGETVKIDKEQFRTEILPQEFENSNDDPQKLSVLILTALEKGFPKECLEPARRLFEIDTDKERGTTILGIVLLHNNSADEAEKLYLEYLEGVDSLVIKFNLAKVYDVQGKPELSFELLTKVVKTNPNFNNALDVYLSIVMEKNGDEAVRTSLIELSNIDGSWLPQLSLANFYEKQSKTDDALNILKEMLESNPNFDKALEQYMALIHKHEGHESVIEALVELAMVEGSWLPKLFLARERLHEKDLETALGIYKTLLESGAPLKGAFTMITGDLGQFGFVPQIIEFALPYYNEKEHGPQGGMHIIRACMETKNPVVGLQVAEKVESLGIPELAKPLEDIKKAFTDITEAVNELDASKE